LNCLNCGKSMPSEAALCSVCSEQLDKDLKLALDRSSKTIFSADQLEITPQGVLILLGERFMAYLKLTPSQWHTLRGYIDQKWPESSE
jgi:hypothetical protein